MAISNVSIEDCKWLLARSMPSPPTEPEALDLADWLSKRLPTGADTDKDQWIDDMTELFQWYAKRDVEFAVKSIDGLRGSNTWLPSIADARKFLNDLAVRRGRIITNAKRIVKQHDERAAEPVLTEAERKVMAEKFAALSSKLKSTPIVEPLAPKPERDDSAARRAKFVAADLASRAATRTPEQQAEHEATMAWLASKREVAA